MKRLLFIATLVTCFVLLRAQQPETYHIFVPKEELTQSMINQLKAFDTNAEGKFLQDDTTNLRKIRFEQDTTKEYVILSWEGLQEPSTIAPDYHLDSVGIEHRIFTASEIKDYINQNEHQAALWIDD